jgi:hypothetical protein
MNRRIDCKYDCEKIMTMISHIVDILVFVCCRKRHNDAHDQGWYAIDCTSENFGIALWWSIGNIS